MSEKATSLRVPSWLISVVVLVLLAVFLERIYISKQPLIIWDKKIGPVSAGTGGSGRTEIWFDLRDVAYNHDECLNRAREALARNGYKEIGVNQGVTIYGYKSDLTAAIWCNRDKKLALISVAGTNQNYVPEQESLVKSFYPLSP